nr:54s ribosomal protein l44, mitochondrial [Quercus suber]
MPHSRTIDRLPLSIPSHRPSPLSAMLTKYITAVTTTFSPFNPRSGKTARNFLALLPPDARRNGMAIDVKMLGQAGAQTPATLALKFKDGKEMHLDLEKMKMKEIQIEVDRHSRILRRQEELAG